MGLPNAQMDTSLMELLALTVLLKEDIPLFLMEHVKLTVMLR